MSGGVGVRSGRWFTALLLAVFGTGCGGARPSSVEVHSPTPHPAAADGAPRRLNLGDGVYERVAEEHGVAVFERPRSSMIQIGAQGKLPAPPAQVLEALLDYERHAAVVERLAECRVLERGDDWLLLYQRLSLPVVSDRDFTLRVRWGAQGEWRWIRYRAVSGGPPPVEDVVRVTKNSGGWDLLPTDGGTATVARYQSNMDMGGSLPDWMTQSGAVDELPSLYRAMCGLLPSPYVARCPG